MRGGSARRRHDDDEEESSFVSMTDMTVGFLFIVILLLAFFASQYNEQDTVPRYQYDIATKQRDDAVLKIAELEVRIEDLTVQIEELETQIADKDRRIAKLEKVVEQLERELEALRKLQGDPLEIYSSQSAQARRNIILRLVEAVQKDIRDQDVAGLNVAISAQGDALRFQGEGLFASESAVLSGGSLQIVRLLGDHLRRELPCFTIGVASKIANGCNPGLSLIETVQVEGHADSDGTYEGNLPLSALRAASALGQMADRGEGQKADILLFNNLLEQPVMAVAAYSSSRPIASNETKLGKAANRRIDLRFIMYVPPGLEFLPQTVEDITAISEKLRSPAAPIARPLPTP